mgnify:CR=1 FL=1
MVTTPKKEEVMEFINETVDKKKLGKLLATVYEKYGTARTAELANALKDLGFQFATKAGVTISIDDLDVPEAKRGLISSAEKEIEAAQRRYERGEITEVATGSGSRPRRIATAPDGMLWVTGNGNGQLMKLDPEKRAIVKSYPMPAGESGAPYAVTIDAAGRIWANEIDTDTVAVFDPTTEKFRVLALPSRNVGIRKAIIDAEGRYWYMGSHNGRLGMIR